MHDVEIDRLVLHLPGVSRERAEAFVGQMAGRLGDHLASAKPAQSARIDDLRIQLETGRGEKESALVERLANAISSEIQGG